MNIPFASRPGVLLDLFPFDLGLYHHLFRGVAGEDPM